MKVIAIITFFMSLALMSIGQSPKFDYFGVKSPGQKIELFAPDIVSLKNSNEKSLAISPFGDEVFFSAGPSWPECKIMHIKKINNQWTEPRVAEFSNDCFSTEPAFSPDGKYLYYSSSKGMQDIKQYCIWRVEKIGNKWGEPQKVIDIPDPKIWEFHPTITKSGTVYFCCWDSLRQVGNIYKSRYSDGVYSEPEKVVLPFDVQGSDTDPFIDPEEKYLITSSTAQNSQGGYDTYIFYKKKDGSWLSPINFGDKFNTPADDNSFDISPDGRFLFIYKQEDVYWTETKGIFPRYVQDRPRKAHTNKR
jgi:Tol biopolymer transport system component